MRRIFPFLVSRFVLGQPRRWLYVSIAAMAWRFARRASGRQPELLYRSTLRRGERFDLLTDKPLPARFQKRRWRRRIAAAAYDELRARR